MLKRKRPGRFFTWFKVSLLLILAAGAGSLYTPYPAALVKQLRLWHRPVRPTPPAPKPEPAPQAEPEPVPVAEPEPAPQTPFTAEPVAWQPVADFSTTPLNLPPFPPALPERVEEGDFEHLNTITPGINLRSNIHFLKGTTASQDRKKKEAYLVRVSMELLLPHAADGKELLTANPLLTTVFRDYERIMATAKVSPWYYSLFLHKQNQIRKNAATLTKLLDRHNFFDTDTLLEIKAPGSGRKVLWLQADMDVVSDGSDGDRLPDMPEKIRTSDHYQPTTAYRWKKRTKTPNPLLPNWEARLQRLLKNKGRADDIQYAKSVIADLKSASFLLAQYDSFIVIPLTLKENRRDRDDSYRPQPGDYAAVIVGKRVFPAIVGDYGPRYKTGEASLRLSKAVNEKADVYARPVSDLGVSYVIFPGTKEAENGPIDYERLNTRCRELLNEMGGLGEGAEFVEMKDLLPSPEPPAPSP